MAKCSVCKQELELYDLFCLVSCRGANSLCNGGCVLLCEECLKRLKKCLNSLDSMNNLDR